MLGQCALPQNDYSVSFAASDSDVYVLGRSLPTSSVTLFCAPYAVSSFIYLCEHSGHKLRYRHERHSSVYRWQLSSFAKTFSIFAVGAFVYIKHFVCGIEQISGAFGCQIP